MYLFTHLNMRRHVCINTILYAYLDDEFTKKIFDKDPLQSILFDLSFADNKS